METPSASPALLSQLSGFDKRIISALELAGITSLTPVQLETLPHALACKDMLVKAKTGTGKTLAFLLPSVHRLLSEDVSRRVPLEGSVDPVRMIILSSTRELANQIVTQASMLTKLIPFFNVECILGGVALNPQKERLDPNTKGQFPYGGTIDILVATPGRLMEHIESTSGFATRLLGCGILVLDEVDQLLETGFQRNIEFIISKLPNNTQPFTSIPRQTLCFSATVPSRLKATLHLALLAEHAVVDCVGEVDVDTHEKIEQKVLVHRLEESLLALHSTITTEMSANPETYKIMCFLPTARSAQFLTALLTEVGLDVMEIHSRKTQAQRTTVSNLFRASDRAILLSSDISARGVDYPNVSLIIQIGAPSSKEVYVQRLGRTGRGDQTGAGVLLLCTYEQTFLAVLKDLPTTDVTNEFKQLASTPESEELSKALHKAAAGVDDDLATQTYVSWLKTFNGSARKMFKWSKQDLVNNANLYAARVLGRSSTPPLPIDAALSMGLKDVTGLHLVEASASDLLALDSEASLASMAPSEPVADVYSLRPLMLVINPVFRQVAKSVVDVLSALSSRDIADLQTALETNPNAVLGGYTITADMVCITKKEPISRSSSISSLPTACMSKSTSTVSLAGMSLSSSTTDLTSAATGPAPSADEMAAALARVKSAGEAIRTSGPEDQAAAQTELLEAKRDWKALCSLGAPKKK